MFVYSVYFLSGDSVCEVRPSLYHSVRAPDSTELPRHLNPQSYGTTRKASNNKHISPYNAEICSYKPWRPKGFFNLKSS